MTGSTRSSNFPSRNAFQGFQTREDAFVTKLDTKLSGDTSLIYSSCLGGVGEGFFDGDDYGQSIAADSLGNAYVTGYTTSLHFPTTPNALQGSGQGGGFDAFVAKVNPNTSGAASLVYSTYLGGNNDDRGFGIALDSSSNAYVTGRTSSTNFPTKNAFQAAKQPGTHDVFVTKLDTNPPICAPGPCVTCQGTLLYSTYIGGSSSVNDSEAGNSIAVDSFGNAYVTGRTVSSDFPMKHAIQAYHGGTCGPDPCDDVFVAKLSTHVAGPASLLYSTYRVALCMTVVMG